MNLNNYLKRLAFIFFLFFSSFTAFTDVLEDMSLFLDLGKSLGYKFATLGVFYDEKSVKTIGTKKRVWFIKHTITDEKMKYFKSYAEFDCIDSFKILDFTMYDSFTSSDGVSVNLDEKKDYYEPESSMDYLAKTVCK